MDSTNNDKSTENASPVDDVYTVPRSRVAYSLPQVSGRRKKVAIQDITHRSPLHLQHKFWHRRQNHQMKKHGIAIYPMLIFETTCGELLPTHEGCQRCRTTGLECWRFTADAASRLPMAPKSCGHCILKKRSCSLRSAAIREVEDDSQSNPAILQRSPMVVSKSKSKSKSMNTSGNTSRTMSTKSAPHCAAALELQGLRLDARLRNDIAQLPALADWHPHPDEPLKDGPRPQLIDNSGGGIPVFDDAAFVPCIVEGKKHTYLSYISYNRAKFS